MCEILDRVENRGIEKGLSQGKSIGEERLCSLINAMAADHFGTDALVRISTDSEYRRKMYRKYGIN